MNKILIFTLCLAAGIVCAQNEPYVLGADISWMQQRENPTSVGGGGVKYYRGNQQDDLLSLLKGVGFNYIRLRIFVDPTAKITGENESPYSAKGYCGLDSTIKVAKRVKAAGMKFLLDFHYSDTWADPGKQYKPVSWSSLNTVPLLAEKVRSYTKETLLAFKNAGALPDMVQVGNEVVGGMIWPEGRNYASGGKGSWTDFATLVNAGINGVKDVDANIKIMMHTITFQNNTFADSWFDNLKSNLNKIEANAANKVDVFGISYYPRWHGNLDTLSKVLTALASKNNIKIAVAEYADKHREVNDLVYNLPSNKGLGTFVWEPQEFAGDNSLPLFDWTNNARRSNSRLELYPQMATDYGLSNSSSSSFEPSSSSEASSSSVEESSSSSEDITPILTANSVEKNMEGTRIYFDGSRVLIKKTLSNGKSRFFDLNGKER